MDDGRWYEQHRYDDIMEEQVTICYISNSITIADTDEMTPYDRGLILKILMQIKNDEKEALEKSMNNK